MKSVFFVFPLIVAALFAGCRSQPEKSGEDFDEALWHERVKSGDISLLYAPHVDGKGRFFNPWMPRSEEPRRSGGPASWLFRKKKEFPPFPAGDYAHRENDYSYLEDREAESISFAGHASMIIKMDGETVFTDPFFSGRALVVGKKLRIPFDFSRVPRRPVVLISHNHYDHLDRYSVKELVKKDAVFIAPLGLKKFFTKLGAKEVYELDWWQDVRIGPLSYTLLPAQHWSRRIGQGSGETLWGSYLIQGSKTVYFSGDTGYFRGFEEYGRLYRIDYAILGAGAYEPRWFMHYSHMNVAEFFMAAEDLKAATAIPMHFGVISLSDEPLVYPLYQVDEFLKGKPGLKEKIRPLRVGEYLELPAD
ncbi:MAG: MBL fold metallo-hydrolase [Treponema sp.]|jgi:L-ascorbate metabolism protein UlaG (beta-lactamase superfamily)|nr:MBL fold metallo-hydrolase [Treponema sp.]